MNRVVSYAAGLVFALGLGISGMTKPSKVIGFLNVKEGWDPSLIFVMVGGILVYTIGYRVIRKRERPILEDLFKLPKHSSIDWRLIFGAAIFGMGWGLGGYCPGPAITSMIKGQADTLAFIMAMLASMFLYSAYEKRRARN